MITTELNSWISRVLDSPYTIKSLNRPVMTRSNSRYDFEVSSWCAHILLNDQYCTLDFYQVGKYQDNNYFTTTLEEYLDFEEDTYLSHGTKKDFKEFYGEINSVIHGFNLPLDLLEVDSSINYELLNVKGYSASVGGIQAQLNSKDHVRDPEIIREKWMPGRTELLREYDRRKKEAQND